MNIEFEIDTKEIRKFADRLGSLHRSAFPSAVRSTLNGAAFDMKKTTLLTSAKQNFEERSKNFFKANSKVIPASGWNVDTMKATTGMKSLNGNNYAVDNLEQQEEGGTIDKKTFIAGSAARVGGRGVPRRQMRIDRVADESIKAYNIRTRRSRSGKQVAVKSEREQFTIAVNLAGKGGFVMTKAAIFRVNSLRKTKRGNKFKLSLIYDKKPGRKVNVKATHFMKEAAMKSRAKMPEIFRKEADYQFHKHLKI